MDDLHATQDGPHSPVSPLSTTLGQPGYLRTRSPFNLSARYGRDWTPMKPGSSKDIEDDNSSVFSFSLHRDPSHVQLFFAPVNGNHSDVDLPSSATARQQFLKHQGGKENLRPTSPTPRDTDREFEPQTLKSRLTGFPEDDREFEPQTLKSRLTGFPEDDSHGVPMALTRTPEILITSASDKSARKRKASSSSSDASGSGDKGDKKRSKFARDSDDDLDEMIQDGVQKGFFRRLVENPDRMAERALHSAENLENEWEEARPPISVEVNANQWNVIRYEESDYLQIYRTHVTTYERGVDGQFREINKHSFDTDLATAKLVDEKLDNLRLGHLTDYTRTMNDLMEGYQKDITAFRAKYPHVTDRDIAANRYPDGTHTAGSVQQAAADLQTKFDEKVKKARDDYQKNIKKIDKAYEGKRKDAYTREGLAWQEGKALLKDNYADRIKSAEDKIGKIPGDLLKNETSIRGYLKALDVELTKTRFQSSSLHAGTGGRYTQSTTEILGELRANLDNHNINGTFDNISELNRRFQHYDATGVDFLNAQKLRIQNDQMRTSEEVYRLAAHLSDGNRTEFTDMARRIERVERLQQTTDEIHALAGRFNKDNANHQLERARLTQRLRADTDALQSSLNGLFNADPRRAGLQRAVTDANTALRQRLNEMGTQDHVYDGGNTTRLADQSQLAHRSLKHELSTMTHAAADANGSAIRVEAVAQIDTEIAAHKDQMKEIKEATAKMRVHFADRNILLEEQDALPIKIERYKRAQDAETMLYNEWWIEQRSKVGKLEAELKAAQEDFTFLTSETERIYSGIKASTNPRGLVGEPLESASERDIESAAAGGKKISAEDVRRYREAQLALELARGKVNRLTHDVAAETAELEVIQKRIELAAGRYNTNDMVREKSMREAIENADEKTIANKRKFSETRINNKLKVRMMIYYHYKFRSHTRNMMLTSVYGLIPNSAQREFQNLFGQIGQMTRW
jgi:hypothetical protein